MEAGIEAARGDPEVVRIFGRFHRLGVRTPEDAWQFLDELRSTYLGSYAAVRADLPG